MKSMKRTLSTGLVLLLIALCGYAQSSRTAAPQQETVVFRFVSQQDMFYIPWGGNGGQLQRLCELVDRYKSEIESGRLPLYVDGYCASFNDAKENFKTAVVRSNRVKSELITNKGLKEEHFVTKNHTLAYEGMKDVVTVTLRIPVAKEELQTVKEQPGEMPKREPVKEEPKQEPKVQPQPAVERPEPVETFLVPVADPFSGFYLRTNLLYDAFLLPALGVEWRITPAWGIKVDGSFSYWGDETDNVQKMWFASPEVRRYMGESKRFYLGLGGNAGKYNVYGYPLGKLLSDDTGYQGKLYGGGLTVGYQLPLNRCLSLDFNFGLGYTRFEYDIFNMVDGVRVYNEKNRTENFWGPTQAGITLVWKIVK